MFSFKALFIIFLLFIDTSFALSDPYQVLEVPKTAPISTIRRAYKRLVRLWHPDKNVDPSAESKFIEINKAYELLLDPERRSKYDKFGYTEPNLNSEEQYTSFNSFEPRYFTRGGFKFTFNSHYKKQSITSRVYENTIIPESSHQPYLILFYGDNCFGCLQLEPLWQKLTAELGPIGLGLATINVDYEPKLVMKIGVGSLPYIIGVADGKVFHFKQSYSLTRVYEFVRKMFPPRLITRVDSSNVDSFLSGWNDNRIRILIFSKTEVIKIRYLIAAFYFNARAVFGHVEINNENSASILEAYNVNKNHESLFIFDEYTNRPLSSVTMPELSWETLKDIVNSNKFLTLSRVANQDIFDDICPVYGNPCLLMTVPSSGNQEDQKNNFRDFIKRESILKSKLNFGYIYLDKQRDLINSLSPPVNEICRLVIIHRTNYETVNYLWLNTSFIDSDVNSLQKELNTINKVTYTSYGFPNTATIPILFDEFGLTLVQRISKRVGFFVDNFWYNVTSQDVLPIISVIGTLALVGILGYFMNYMAQQEEKLVNPKGTLNVNNNIKKPESKLQIHELRGETYNGLIRLLKPGCRTLILLVDAESKPKLLPKFFRHVYPYRKNKTLMFGFLMVEKNIDWYQKILMQALVENKELNINPKNCVGTVLSINGYRKYFCVYHAKQASLLAKKKETSDSDSGDERDVESGSHLTTSTECMEDEVPYIFEEKLLDKLPMWLDRLFEGSTQRYYIQYWPENMK